MSTPTTRTLVLGVLRHEPMHGYEVKAALESWGAESWAGITYGSIYFALKKMATEGLLEIERTERAGTRPERTVYAITDEGRRAFERLVRELWWGYAPTLNAFTVAATFIDVLPREEALAALRARMAGLRQAIEAFPYIEKAKRTHGGAAAAAATRLTHKQAVAELEWLEETAAAVERGELP